jgi:hypothetical protein
MRFILLKHSAFYLAGAATAYCPAQRAGAHCGPTMHSATKRPRACSGHTPVTTERRVTIMAELHGNHSCNGGRARDDHGGGACDGHGRGMIEA